MKRLPLPQETQEAFAALHHGPGARGPIRCLGKACLSNAAEGRQVIPCHAHPSAPQLGVFCTWTNTEALEVTGTVVKLLQSTYVWEFFILL